MSSSLPCVPVKVCCCFQVRDLSVAYLLVGLTYLYVGVLIFAAFPSPPLSKECIEPVRPAFLLLDDTGRFLSFIHHIGSLSSARTHAHLVAFDSSVTHSSVYFYTIFVRTFIDVMHSHTRSLSFTPDTDFSLCCCVVVVVDWRLKS